MEFRWIIVVTLWTLLIGPIVGVPSGSASRDPAPVKAKVKTPAPR
jgi:hypothetical protein